MKVQNIHRLISCPFAVAIKDKNSKIRFLETISEKTINFNEIEEVVKEQLCDYCYIDPLYDAIVLSKMVEWNYIANLEIEDIYTSNDTIFLVCKYESL